MIHFWHFLKKLEFFQKIINYYIFLIWIKLNFELFTIEREREREICNGINKTLNVKRNQLD